MHLSIALRHKLDALQMGKGQPSSCIPACSDNSNSEPLLLLQLLVTLVGILQSLSPAIVQRRVEPEVSDVRSQESPVLEQEAHSMLLVPFGRQVQRSPCSQVGHRAGHKALGRH